MGRRKKKIDFEKIHPLESVTIGVIKPPRFVLFKTILLVGIFGAVIFFMPEIKIYLDEKLLPLIGMGTPSDDTQNPNPNSNTTTGEEKPVDNPNIYVIGETTEVDLSEKYYVTFSNIGIDESSNISMEINTTQSNINLDNSKLYLLLYNNDNILLAHYRINGVLDKDNPVIQTYSSKDASKFSIEYLNRDDYPIVYEVLTNDENEGEVICTKNSETYKYSFNDSQLKKIDFTTSFSEEDPNYNDFKEKYNELKLNYDEVPGYTVSYDIDGTLTNFKLSVDYNEANKSIDTGRFYSKNEKYDVILFELEGEQYDCKITDLTKKSK